MSNMQLEYIELKKTVKQIILELFSENREEFSDIFLKLEVSKKGLDLEESARLYAEIYAENNDLQELTESALLDFIE